MSKVKVLIVDDHALVREGVIALLKYYEDIEIVGEASSGSEAIEKVHSLGPDVVLMDIAMPGGLGGLEASVEIRKQSPETRILILSQYDDKEYVSRLLKAGVAGYILKHAIGTDLIAAIRAVSKGGFYLYPSVASGVVEGFLGKTEIKKTPYEKLTDREKQILKLLAEGHSHKEVAGMLDISVKTVIAHQTHISEKTGMHSRAELIKFAIREGIIKA